MDFSAELFFREPGIRVLVADSHPMEILKAGKAPVPTSRQAEIRKAWKEVRKNNHGAFAGPTVRMTGWSIVGDRGKILRVSVAASNYKEAMALGWLGVAMVPVTSDGYVALQAPVKRIAAIVGDGIRVPGCTPPHAEIFPHIIKEMKEEFNVDVEPKQLLVVGLVEVNPPLAMFHHSLIVNVALKETFEQLKAKWKTAEDKWEGEILPFKLTAGNVIQAMFFEQPRKYGPVTPIALYLVAKGMLAGVRVS